MGKYVICRCGGRVHKQSKSGLCYKCWLTEKRLKSPYIQGSRVRGGSQWKNSYGQTHYALNRKEYIEKATKRRKENWSKLIEYKKGLECMDCRIKDFRVLDFDHLPGNKQGRKMEVSSITNRGLSWERILEEIKKCEVVCSNCHRLRTWNRKNNVGMM